MSPSLAPYFARLESCTALRWQGRVTQLVGPLVESEGPFCSVGEICHLYDADGRTLPGEIVGFRGSTVLSMPLDLPRGIRRGDRIVTWGERPALRVSDDMLGRVIDGQGQPLDSLSAYRTRDYRPLDAPAPLPLERESIREPISCGIRAVDAFLTCGRGQRVGIFGGSGVGKSTLIGMMARNTEAEINVLGLVGERGREVRDFLENSLGAEGRRRSVVVVSTSDQSPLLRIRAALAATTVAEYFCRQGKNVLLIVDSLTRLAMAQREVSTAPHLQKAHELRRLLAAYTASEDLIRIGAYQKGSDPTLDKALAIIPDLNRFLMQKPGDSVSFSDSITKLLALPS